MTALEVALIAKVLAWSAIVEGGAAVRENAAHAESADHLVEEGASRRASAEFARGAGPEVLREMIHHDENVFEFPVLRKGADVIETDHSCFHWIGHAAACVAPWHSALAC